jgi:hypothetical protein
MADVLTPIYDFTQPEVGASKDTWGDKLNANWEKVDLLLGQAFTGGDSDTIGTIDPDILPTGADGPYVRKSGDTMTSTLGINHTSPTIRLTENDRVLDTKVWDIQATGSNLSFLPRNDLNGALTGSVTLLRDALGVTDMRLTAQDATLVPTTTSVITAARGDARYLQLNGALPATGALTIENTAPRLTLYEVGGATTNNRASLVLDANVFVLQTRDDVNTNKGDMYRVTLSATGASEHLWRINNIKTLTLDNTGLDVVGSLGTTGNATIGGLINCAGTIETDAGLYVNVTSAPSLYLRDAAKQVGARLYVDGVAGVGNFRIYESFASANYVGYGFRYSGASSIDDVLRIREGDLRYVNIGGSTTTLTVSSALTVPAGGSVTNPPFEFGTTNTGILAASDGSMIRFAVEAVTAAQIDAPGTAAASTYTVMTREKGDARYALDATYAQYTSSSSSTLTSFPIGTVLSVFSGGRSFNRNASTAIALSTSNSGDFVDGADGSAGTTLSGTWRMKGRVNTGGPTYYNLAQRVA